MASVNFAEHPISSRQLYLSSCGLIILFCCLPIKFSKNNKSPFLTFRIVGLYYWYGPDINNGNELKIDIFSDLTSTGMDNRTSRCFLFPTLNYPVQKVLTFIFLRLYYRRVSDWARITNAVRRNQSDLINCKKILLDDILTG